MRLACKCGAVRGELSPASPSSGNRVVCYCDDCQAFARWLGRDDAMDPRGGTDVFQVSPSQVAITAGADELRCVRLSEKGLFRWYTDCCKTPIGNMVGARLPFIGVVTACLQPEPGRSKDDVLGPPIGGILGVYATGGCPPGVHPKVPGKLMLRIFPLVARWFLQGKGQPQPFFDARTRAPRTPPRVLTRAERAAVTPAIRAG